MLAGYGTCLLKNVWEKTKSKKYYPVKLLTVVSKMLVELVNNRLFDHLK